jgi:spore maturation protein CgeB
MEVVEILSHYIDKTQNLINVEFRVIGDDDDLIREDLIEYTFFEEFGFDNKKNFEIFNEVIEESDEWEDDDVEYFNDEETLISFLNEYYVVYPKKLPKAQFR